MKKSYRTGILFCLVLSLFGCAPQSQGEEYIYITHETHHEWEIWKVAIDGSVDEMLYRLPKWITMDSSPGDELFTQDVKHQLQEEHPTVNPVQFETYISVDISPNKRLMTIDESFMHCPGNWCYGQFSITVINLETKEEIFKFASIRPVDFSNWSNDSTLLVFEELDAEFKAHTYTIHIWDVQTAHEVFVTPGRHPRFIGDSHKILAKYYIESQESYGKNLACCRNFDLDGLAENKPIAETTQYNSYYESSLSPDGKKIALVIPLENSVEVKIADFENLVIESTILSGNIDDRIWGIDWSPDGKFIAIDSDRNDEDFFEVMDSQSGELRYFLKEVVDWQWSSRDQKILYVTRDLENTCVQTNVEVKILDMQDGSIKLIELPEEIRNYVDSNVDGMICIWFIRDVSW